MRTTRNRRWRFPPTLIVPSFLLVGLIGWLITRWDAAPVAVRMIGFICLLIFLMFLVAVAIAQGDLF